MYKLNNLKQHNTTQHNMIRFLKELAKKHGAGIFMSAITIDGYRRTVKNDRADKTLETVKAKEAEALERAKAAKQEEMQKNIADTHEKAKESAVMGRHNEAALEFQSAAEAFKKDPSDYRNDEVGRANTKLAKAYEEYKEVREKNFFEYLNSFYNNYNEYLENLTPDKIVCVFNIIIGTLTLSSFVSILTIMLSENIINKIKFLERYPRILKLLRLRNSINKKIAKLYLFIHFVLILWSLLSNTYMLFL